MPYLIAVVNLAGLIVFATLLWPSRARVAGLAAFALRLTVLVLFLAMPPVISLGSPWEYLGRMGDVLLLASDLLLLGAVYALRPNDSATSAGRERKMLRAAGTLMILGLALASLSVRWLSFADHAATIIVLLLALVAMLLRWGASPVGLLGAAGFGLLAVPEVVACLARFLSNGQPLLPFELTAGVALLGLLAVIGGFALAGRQPAVHQQPYPGVATIGMNFSRWVGVALVVAGAVLFLVLGYAITEMHILKGIKGRAAILAALLPAAGLYLTLIGVVRLTTGRAVWARNHL